jgi:hypothetical protein
MTADRFAHATEGVDVDAAAPVSDASHQRLREFYGVAYDSFGMGV